VPRHQFKGSLRASIPYEHKRHGIWLPKGQSNLQATPPSTDSEMRSLFVSTLAGHGLLWMLLGAASRTSGAQLPLAPRLEYLYTLNITGGAAISLGPGPLGTRLVVPIVNGTFGGPKLKGCEQPRIVASWPPRDKLNLWLTHVDFTRNRASDRR
jgi:hypothetical protein